MRVYCTETVPRQNFRMRKCLLSTSAIAVLTVAVLVYAALIMTAHVYVITPVSVSASKPHCQHLIKKSKNVSVTKTPPWLSETIIGSSSVLYVWPEKVANLRLGNRLFNYASTFGIAWRNRRLPILPSNIKAQAMYDLTAFFNIRMPVDHGNRIIKVTEVILVNKKPSVMIYVAP